MRKKAIFVVLIWLGVAAIALILYSLQEVSPVKEFIAWALSVWQILAALGGIGLIFSGWVIRHDFGKKAKTGEVDIPKTIAQDNIQSVIASQFFSVEITKPEFGISGEGGFPKSKKGNLILRLGIALDARPSILVESLKLDIMGEQFEVEAWESRKIYRDWSQYIYLAIPKSVSRGEHEVKLVAWAGGNAHYSKGLSVDFP